MSARRDRLTATAISSGNKKTLSYQRIVDFADDLTGSNTLDVMNVLRLITKLSEI